MASLAQARFPRDLANTKVLAVVFGRLGTVAPVEETDTLGTVVIGMQGTVSGKHFAFDPENHMWQDPDVWL